jgi:uncharacterized protein
MKFAIADDVPGNIIRAYTDDSVIVGDTAFKSSLIILNNQIITDWRPNCFDELEAADFDPLVAVKPDLVVLGTGPKQQFPIPALYQALVKAGIGLEIMNTPAACRTYNILLSEGRKVAAALLLK